MLLTATLDLRGDRVKEKMIKVEDFFMLEEKSVIDLEMVKEIVRRDFSYVLVYRGSRGSIIGIIKIKEFTIKYLQS